MVRDSELRFYRCKYPTGNSPIPEDDYLCQHSLECDDVDGIAWELLTGWLQNEEASVHTLGDRSEVVQGFDYDSVAWHCGNGNQHGSGHEIVGRASWSVEQWNTPTMDQAMRHQARMLARKWVFRTMPKYGITYLPEWLSLAQIAEGKLLGLVTHNDMRLVFGGTTHTDPGPNFPYQKLRDYIHAEIATLLGSTPVIVVDSNTNTDGSIPVTTKPEGDANDMADITEAQMKRIAELVWGHVLKNKASAEDNIVATTSRAATIINYIAAAGGVNVRLNAIKAAVVALVKASK